jgi:hypothetical protein
MGCELEFGPRPSEVHVVRLVSLWQLPEPEPPLTGWAKFKANLKSKLCFGPPMTVRDRAGGGGPHGGPRGKAASGARSPGEAARMSEFGAARLALRNPVCGAATHAALPAPLAPD